MRKRTLSVITMLLSAASITAFAALSPVPQLAAAQGADPCGENCDEVCPETIVIGGHTCTKTSWMCASSGGECVWYQCDYDCGPF